MEQFIIVRIGKPLLMFGLTFFAIKYLTGSAMDGVLLGGIPLVLGSINILAAFGYVMTAISIVLAVMWAVLSTDTRAHIAAGAAQVETALASGFDDHKDKPSKHP